MRNVLACKAFLGIRLALDFGRINGGDVANGVPTSRDEG
jgi:hypothetical protein